MAGARQKQFAPSDPHVRKGSIASFRRYAERFRFAPKADKFRTRWHVSKVPLRKSSKPRSKQ